MGEIADAMIEGEICAMCGVYLEPNETVYGQTDGKEYEMPSNGEGMGFPVLCSSCH